MKKLINLTFISLVILALSSCGGPKEKVLKVGDHSLTGEISQFFKIVDGDYFLKEAEYSQTYISVDLELLEKYDEYDGIDFIFHSVKLELLSNGADVVFGTSYITTDFNKLEELLIGEVGDKKTITFKWISDENGVERIFNEAESFQLTGIDVTLSDIEPDKLPRELFGQWYGKIDENIFTLKFDKSSKKKLFIRDDNDDLIYRNAKYSIWKNKILIDLDGKEEKFNYSFEKGNQILVLQSTTNEYKIRLAKNKNALDEIEPVSRAI